MGSGGRVCWLQLWLTATLTFFFQICPSAGSPLMVMSAPNLLRVGTEETIFVEIQNYQEDNDLSVQIFVKNHPTKTRTLASTAVILKKANKFQEFGRITIPTGDFSKDPKVKQYVTLQANIHGTTLEKVVLVSFQSGYIFIQTDKPIYTPNSKVHFRIFPMTPGMEPLEKHIQSQADTSITVEVMNPAGFIVKSKTVSADLTSRIYSDDYQLTDIVSFGQWKILAKFHSNLEESFTAEFEVKEYVLPSFEVKISPPSDSPFFYIDGKELNFTIKATYIFGKEVDGTAYVVFGLMQGDTKISFTSSLQRVPIQGGTGMVTLKREHITNAFPNIHQQEGKSIYVAVSVLTESGSEMVEAELSGIKIVKSPYSIRFTKTPRYFKPGMSFDVMVEVLNPDNSPANGVNVVVEPGQVMGITNANGMMRLSVNTVANSGNLNITAKTNHPKIDFHRQASASMEVYPYRSRSNSFLQLSVDTAKVDLDTNIKVTFNLNNPETQQNDITYLILSRGQLIKYYRYKNNNQNQFALMVQITKEMLPSFRIIAYYHTSSNEVVADSLWVDVEDTCMGKLELKLVGPTATYEPRKSFILKITGVPKALVGLVAVDNGVYALNNKNRLTQKKIWDIVEKYDTGCTAGGGSNNMNVFYDAGLLFETNNGGTPYRTDLACPSTSRRKRATTIMEVKTSLVRDYENLQKECCLDGMKDIPMSYTCERRSEYIAEGLACKEAFLRCCKTIQKYNAERREDVLLLARSKKDNLYTGSDYVHIRSNFPESWLWSDITLNPCPNEDLDCTLTSTEIKKPLPDTITTWQLTGISLSKTYGICVSSPVELIAFKPVFIDLRLPYSAVVGEQLEIKAIIHNYGIDLITVLVKYKEHASVCSAAYKKGWFTEVVQVGAQSTRSVPIIIIPMKHGTVPIEVMAYNSNNYADGIRKSLRVVPQGVQRESLKRLTLEPVKNSIDGRQKEVINSEVSRSDVVPGAPMRTFLSLTGFEQLSPLLDNAITGKSMGTLIKEPMGCGEQNAAAMTLPLIAARYLDKANQWEIVGFDKRNEAIQHIKTGYETELSFQKKDGSFAVYQHHKSTTWLTAYVAKVFAMAYDYVAIDPNVLCGAIKFLILKTQQPDGVFVEIGEIWDKDMIGDVGGVDSDASMTAFCVIAMQESRTICSGTVSSLPHSIAKAVSYLEKRLLSITNPYAVAMTSYALANENKLNKMVLFQFASQDRTHWSVRNQLIYTLEATAYALLALLKVQAFEEAKPVVRWLSQQQMEGGGYGSTQVTIMVYQAVAEYCSNVKKPPYDMNVDIQVHGKTQIDKFQFNRENHFSARTSNFNGINQNITVTATGTGEVMFNILSVYYAMPSKRVSDCEMFDLTLDLSEEKIDETERIYKLRIEVLYKNKVHNASMSILDVGLPTGYIFNKNDLDSISSGHGRIIDKYETNTALSEKGSLIIYLRTISNTRPEEISFRIEQKHKVGVLQPAAVSVYEYYNKKQCVKFYRPERQDGELLRLCKGDACICAEESCSKQLKEGIRNDDRTNKACESTQTSKIDFVYKVAVEGFHGNYTTDKYSVRILDIIKENPFSKRLYKYMFGANTWVEYWPTESECQTEKYRPTCLGMEDLVEQYRDFGCHFK
ncbi:complement C3-like [Nematolebias whitei]|uniref:complement C3-like n=1 Tax=Nematolebias whitei TaxID=451745 RepID=UPI00189C3D0D|nr:complement C3-like [Nematolebias whitei]